MTIELTTQQALAVRDAQGPVDVVDPATKDSWVLVRADAYRQLLEYADEFNPRELYPYVDKVMAEDDEHDPTLAEYQEPPPTGQSS